MFTFANVLAGIGFGFVNPVLIALVTDITPGSNIPKKMGYLGAVANLGIGIGPLVAAQFIVIGWRYLYLLFIIIIVLSLLILYKVKKPPFIKSPEVGIRSLFINIGKEIKRPVIVLLIIASFLTSQIFLGTIIWTSRAYTGVIEESISGIILAGVGLAGAISAYLTGPMLKKLGPQLTLIIGMSLELIAIIILLLFGNIDNPQNIWFSIFGMLLTGAAVGIFFPYILFHSQTLSKERRGVLAGLASVSQFISVALIPTTYELSFHVGGISTVYYSIFIVFLIFLIVLVIFSISAKKNNNNNNIIE